MLPTEAGRTALRKLTGFGRAHWRTLGIGVGATVGVVACRLAMPWPLCGVLELVFGSETAGHSRLVDKLPAVQEPALWLVGAYFVLAIGIGAFEFIQRTQFKRFASRTTRDLRSAAVQSCTASADHGESGEIIARVVGDSARLKAALSGILVHLLQNALIFVGVCAVLLIVSPQLGLIYVGAGAIAVAIGTRTSHAVAATSERQRKKEAAYAVAIQHELESGGNIDRLRQLNKSSSNKDVKVTRLIAGSSWIVHMILAASVALGLWVGVVGVRAGTVAPGALFLFIAYSLTVHRRLVQIGRQAARTGKVVTCVSRIASLIQKPHRDGAPNECSTRLEHGLILRSVSLVAGNGAAKRKRLRRIDLEIAAGSRVAVVGEAGSGKSSLLQVIAGLEVPRDGTVAWDSETGILPAEHLRQRCDFLPQAPTFARTEMWRLLNFEGPHEPTGAQLEILRLTGAHKVIARQPRKLEQRVSSAELSRYETRSIALAAFLSRSRSWVWILDAPLEGMSRRRARRLTDGIFRLAGDRTVIFSLNGRSGLERFDQVIELRRGRMGFAGSPVAWNECRSARSGAPDGRVRHASGLALGGEM